jgi:LacI family transcriptional regulator
VDVPVSIQEVADKAGVSRGTVSHVLNNRTSARIASATQDRVRRAARDLGYRPNAIARSLRTQRTNILGLYTWARFVDPRLPVFAELMYGLETGCLEAQQDLLMQVTNPDHISAEAAFAEMMNGKVDGIVLQTVPEDRLVELLGAAHFPLVSLLDRIPAIPCIIADASSGNGLLAEHLADKGHRRVLYRLAPNPTENIRARADAFLNAATALGIDVTTIVLPDWSGEMTADELAILQRRGSDRFTAVVGCSDMFAYPVCDACDDLGIRIPEEIAVAGYSGVKPPMKPLRRLTTIRAPWSEMGVKAVELLMAVINGESVPDETVFPVEFVIGDTT